jgi:hypothetical protein
MATTRLPLRGTAGLRFHKLLGTGSGRTFTVRDADPRHWALLTVWDDEELAIRATASNPAMTTWDAVCDERLVVRMTPIVSRGTWGGRQPFGDPSPRRVLGPVASITRARLAVRSAATFWRAVPAVSADLHQVAGLRLAVGVGEAPVGLQGTFSLWDGARALTDFAHRRPAHLDAVRRTPIEGWYVEELFARFEVIDVDGTFNGAHP